MTDRRRDKESDSERVAAGEGEEDAGEVGGERAERGLQRSIVNRRAHKRARSPDPAGNHTSRRLLVLCPSSSVQRTRRRESRGATKAERRARSPRRPTIRTGDCSVLQD